MKKELSILLVSILLLLFSVSGSAQEDKFTYLIEDGPKMIRENQVDKVFDMIRELPSEKKSDFRIKVIENFAYLKGYLLTKRRGYGDRWKLFYNTMLLSGDRSATPVLLEFLKDGDHYVRDYAVTALGYIGDERALDELKRISDQDEKGKVRRRAKWAHEQIAGIKPSEKSEEGSTEKVTVIGSRYTAEPKYFHKPDCRRVRTFFDQSAVKEISKREALKEGYTPCPDCMGVK
jgi:hypothetical protein